MGSTLSPLILQELKRLLKQAKAPYKDLASALRVSESGLKKIMNAKDCSVSRLEQICEFLGVSLADVIRDLEDQNLRGVSFTPEQEKYFTDHRDGFLLYWFLVYERRSVDESRVLLKLSEKDAWKILNRLDKLELLELLPENKLRIPHPQGISWLGQTKFMTELYLKWSHSLVDQVVKASERDSRYLMIRYLQMSEATWLELKAAMGKIEKTFANRAVREMRLQGRPLKHVRWLTLADHRSWGEEETKESL